MNSLKIIFFITTVGHGKGGHFYSLKSIAEELSKENEVIIINIGKKKSPVLNNSFVKCIFIHYHFSSLTLITVFKILKIVKLFNPNILHAFDVESLFFCRLISYFYKAPIFLTKSGGPNPKHFFPRIENLIVYSKENYDYFLSTTNHQNINVHLIPNRVSFPYQNMEKITQLKKIYNINEKDYIILRIGRITEHYYQTIIQGINLTKKLIHSGILVKYLCIGTIQNNETYNNVLKIINENKLNNHIFIETNSSFTNEASSLLSIGKLILGTGRNFMEACALGKSVMVPTSTFNIPLLIDDDITFNLTFTKNFSPRTNPPPEWYNDNLNKIINTITNNIDHSSITTYWFKKYFDINKAKIYYIEAYNKSISLRNPTFLNLTLHYLKLLKTFAPL